MALSTNSISPFDRRTLDIVVGTLLRNGSSGSQESPLEISRPIPLHRLEPQSESDLDAMLRETHAGNADLRYIVQRSNDILLVDLNADRKLIRCVSGTFARRFVNVIVEAEKRLEAESGYSYLHIVEIPVVNASALWIQSPEGVQRSVFVTLQERTPGLRSEDFLTEVRLRLGALEPRAAV